LSASEERLRRRLAEILLGDNGNSHPDQPPAAGAFGGSTCTAERLAALANGIAADCGNLPTSANANHQFQNIPQGRGRGRETGRSCMAYHSKFGGLWIDATDYSTTFTTPDHVKTATRLSNRRWTTLLSTLTYANTRRQRMRLPCCRSSCHWQVDAKHSLGRRAASRVPGSWTPECSHSISRWARRKRSIGIPLTSW
jgi:hypothetical protein